MGNFFFLTRRLFIKKLSRSCSRKWSATPRTVRCRCSFRSSDCWTPRSSGPCVWCCIFPKWKYSTGTGCLGRYCCRPALCRWVWVYITTVLYIKYNYYIKTKQKLNTLLIIIMRANYGPRFFFFPFFFIFITHQTFFSGKPAGKLERRVYLRHFHYVRANHRRSRVRR